MAHRLTPPGEVRCLEAIASSPNLLVPWYLMASFAYYQLDEALLEDATYDVVCRRLKAEWDSLAHVHKRLIDQASLNAGTGFTLRYNDYPSRVRSACGSILWPTQTDLAICNLGMEEHQGSENKQLRDSHIETSAHKAVDCYDSDVYKGVSETVNTMFIVRPHTAYGVTRDAVISGTIAMTKDALFHSALQELTGAVAEEIAKELRDTSAVFELIHGPRDTATDAETWEYTRQGALVEAMPAMYAQHITADLAADARDIDTIAINIAGWVVNGMAHDAVGKIGAFLSDLGILPSDYLPPSSTETENADADRQALEVTGASKTEVATAWQQFGQALEFDQGNLAKSLGVSKSTVSNYGAGRTQAKCSAEQAVIMSAECKSRAALLLSAAEVFERVK